MSRACFEVPQVFGEGGMRSFLLRLIVHDDNQSAYEEATMAALEVTKKLLIYHTLYRLNLSFSNILTHCQTLHEAGVFTSHDMRLFKGYAQELQAEMNQELSDSMHQTELEDWGRFGKIRQAEEKRLRDPDDVFIHAEERKKELAKKRKKSKRKPTRTP
jgi:hypothetical protein